MPTIGYGVSLSGGGVSISRSINRTADGIGGHEVTLPVGYAGTLSTRTDNDTGIVTLAGGHAITTGMIVDIHFADGVQYKVTVGTVAGNSMPFDSGVGTVLPIATTAVVVTPRVQVNAAIDGDTLSILGIEAGYPSSSSTAKSHVEFQDAADAVIATKRLAGNQPLVYDITAGTTNPFTGNPITKLFASNGSSTEVATLKLTWVQDTTP